MQVPGGDRIEQACRQAGAMRPRDDDEQSHEEHEQTPVDLVVDAFRFHGSGNEQHGRANRGRHGGRHTREKAAEHRREHDHRLHPHRPQAELGRAQDVADGRAIAAAPETQPVDHRPVQEQPHDGDRAEMQHEFEIAQARQRADEHVLRVSRDGRHAADVGRRGDRDQVGHDRQAEPPRHVQHERRHHQADDVVDEKRGESAAGQDDDRQQVMGVQTRDDPFGDVLEEPAQPQVGDDDHHREQQHDGREVDRLQRLVRPDNAERHHQHRADDGGARAVDLHPRDFPEGEDAVAADEDGVGGEDPGVREHGRRWSTF